MDEAQTAFPFEIEGILEIHGRAYVFARLLDGGTGFTVSETAMLDGIQVEQWSEVPRSLDEHGQPRLDLFAFCLRHPVDQHRLTLHSRVELRLR